MPLTMNNFRGIWLSAIVLAQKVWDDNPLRTSQFNVILPAVGKSLLRDLERKTLNMIEFSTNVKPSLYAKYYFELRTLFTDITGNDSVYQWNLKPLTIIEAKQLDMRTKRSVLEIRCARAMGDLSVITSPAKVKLSPVNKNKNKDGESSSNKQQTTTTTSADNNQNAATATGTDGNSVVSAVTTSVVSKTRTRKLRPINASPHMATLEDVTRIDTTRYVLS